MLKNITIAIDAMGGDNFPRVAIDAVIEASSRYHNVSFLLYGNRSTITEADAIALGNIQNIKFINTDKKVTSEDQPSQILRSRKGTSMCMAIEAVKNGEADAAISAGNTGALMAIAKTELGVIQGISRPAICTMLPSLKGPFTALDLGANVDCTPEQMLEFAIMGISFFKAQNPESLPRVGIINIGHESIKGNDLTRKSFELISNAKLNVKSISYVEPDDAMNGDIDILVSDGFSGNLMLKSLEAIAKIFLESIKGILKSNWLTMLASLAVKDQLYKFFHTFDPNNNNGAMLVGLNGIVIKSHGNANKKGFLTAISIAATTARHNVNKDVLESISAIAKTEKKVD